MARRSRSEKKGPLWHGYRRPVWRDGVFWLAFGAAIVGLIVQNAFAKFEATTSGWVILGIEVAFTFLIAFALIGVVAGTLRGFGEGWRQAEKAAPPRGPAARPAKSSPDPASEPKPKATAQPEAEAEADPGAGAQPVVEAAPEPATPVASEPVVEAAPSTEPEVVPAAAVVEPEPEPQPAAAAVSDPEPSDRPKAGVEMERHARRLGRAIGAGRRTYKKYNKD